jgi:hypothetical protein
MSDTSQPGAKRSVPRKMLQPAIHPQLSAARVPWQALELCLRTPNAQVGSVQCICVYPWYCASCHDHSVRARGGVRAILHNMLTLWTAVCFRNCKRSWHVLLATAHWLLPLRQRPHLCLIRQRDHVD